MTNARVVADLGTVTSTPAEINYLDISTLGTSEAAKAVTADSGAKVKYTFTGSGSIQF